MPFAAEKKTAVRAFCTATSQLNIVVFGVVQNVPSTTGATPLAFGLFTTVMNTCAAVPRGRRIPARVVRVRFAAAAMMLVTSCAVSRAVPPGNGTAEGSAMIGWRNWPDSPPRFIAGYANGAGEAIGAYGKIFFPGKLANEITAPRLVELSMYSSRIPFTKSCEPKIAG